MSMKISKGVKHRIFMQTVCCISSQRQNTPIQCSCSGIDPRHFQRLVCWKVYLKNRTCQNYTEALLDLISVFFSAEELPLINSFLLCDVKSAGYLCVQSESPTVDIAFLILTSKVRKRSA